MNTYLLIWLPVLITFRVTGQATTEHYWFPADIEKQLAADSVAWKYQTAAVNYAFVARYDQALATWDKGVPIGSYVPTSADTVLLESARVADARDYIVERSRSEQVVIINEAHHNAKHRAFTRSLLEGLYRNGYRYLGLEAIQDSAINSRDFAVETSGYYTCEPEFGNLINEARRLGFVLFGYEASAGKNGKEREMEQAANIQAFMAAHPDGKYLIHCGFDHAFEQEMRSWEKAMAGRLYEYTGINPLTIDQVKFTEKSSAEYGHYFVYATDRTAPFVLVLPDSSVFNGFSSPRQTDMTIIHPLTTYTNGRACWQYAGKTVYQLPSWKRASMSYPAQVLAYRSGEYARNGVPADVIVLNSDRDSVPLLLADHRYDVLIRNSDYVVTDSFTVVIGAKHMPAGESAVRVDAVFPGGQPALIQYLVTAVQYPESAHGEQQSGSVCVQFVVARNGKVKRVMVDRGAHPALGAEAKRVVTAMPRWQPAMKGTRKVRSKQVLPIRFAP